MEDQFFTKLREIQKNERVNSSLARIGNDFYKKTHKYLHNIRDIAINDPLSEESRLLKNVQRIVNEICEIREHKIADAAVINIHRSYHLFEENFQFDLVDTAPLHMTEEEKSLYFSLINVLSIYRRNIPLDKINTTNNEDIFEFKNTASNKKRATRSNNFNNNFNELMSKENSGRIDTRNNEYDQVLNRLHDIKSDKLNGLDELSHSKTLKSSKIPKSYESQESNKSKQSKKQDNKINSNKDSKFAELHPQINVEKKQNSELDNIIRNDDEKFTDLDNIRGVDGHDFNNMNSNNKFRSTPDKIINTMVLIFSDIDPIIGVDKKNYGPFKPQDIVVMPDINVNILVKNKKGRLIKSWP